MYPIKTSILRSTDDRGTFSNINFNINREHIKFTPKRTYTIINSHAGVIRAWHGHRKEAKMFYVPKGRALFRFIPMDNFEEPITSYALSEDNPEIIYCPPGYYNGFVSLTDDTIIMTFSDSTIKESVQDDYRLEYDEFGTKGWSVEHR